MEFEFEQTKDAELIRSVVTHPKIFKHWFDDNLPDPETWRPILTEPGIVWVVVRSEGQVIGLFMISAHNRIAWETHDAFLPKAWGRQAQEAAIAFREWIWNNSECQRLFGWIVKSNRLALKFAKAAGMKVCGINERSFMKNGVVQDQLLVGISRPEGR